MLTVLASLLVLVTVSSDESVTADQKKRDQLLRFVNDVSNLWDDSELADLQLEAREAWVRTRQSLKVRSTEQIAAHYYGLGTEYLRRRRYDDSFRVLEAAIAAAPDSYAAAKASTLIGDTYQGNFFDAQSSIEHFERADEILAGIETSPDLASESLRKLLKSRVMLRYRLSIAEHDLGKHEAATVRLEEVFVEPKFWDSVSGKMQAKICEDLLIWAENRDQQENVTRYRGALAELAKGGRLNPDYQLKVLIAGIRSEYPDFRDDVRRDAMRKLWQAPEYIGLKRLLIVGEELLIASYLSNDRHGFQLDASDWEERFEELSKPDKAAYRLMANRLYVMWLDLHRHSSEFQTLKASKIRKLKTLNESGHVEVSLPGWLSRNLAQTAAIRLVNVLCGIMPEQAKYYQPRQSANR